MTKQWQTPTRGKFSYDEMCQAIKDYVRQTKPKEYEYFIHVGTDSQRHSDGIRFIAVIMIHREGKGGQYYWTSETIPYMSSFNQKIPYEMSLTRQHIDMIKVDLKDLIEEYNISIIPDIDIGENGKTKQFIQMAKNMFGGFGHEKKGRIKPYSPAASSVANKHSK